MQEDTWKCRAMINEHLIFAAAFSGYESIREMPILSRRSTDVPHQLRNSNAIRANKHASFRFMHRTFCAWANAGGSCLACALTTSTSRAATVRRTRGSLEHPMKSVRASGTFSNQRRAGGGSQATVDQSTRMKDCDPMVVAGHRPRAKPSKVA